MSENKLFFIVIVIVIALIIPADGQSLIKLFHISNKVIYSQSNINNEVMQVELMKFLDYADQLATQCIRSSVT